jgi:hypothetical protein
MTRSFVLASLNPSAQILPILDLRKSAPERLFRCQSLPAQFCENLVEMRRQFDNHLGPLRWLQRKSSEVALDKRLPIRHATPW